MTDRQMPIFRIGALVLAVLSATACTTNSGAAKPDEVPEIRPGILQGYLPATGLPNALALLPPPPEAQSAAQAMDDAVSAASLKLRDSKRWALAAQDNNLMFPQAAGTFSCAVGSTISEGQTPHLYTVLRRTLADAGLATYTAKNFYTRPRPFTVNGAAVCTSDEEKAHLVDDGSYPSGHTAIGWAWALILAQLAPDRADAIFARGRAFGQSRVVCNVHWQSDVIEGRFIGAAAVSQLQSNAGFLADMAMAQIELDAVRQQGVPPLRDCVAEAEALAEVAPEAPWPAGR